MKKICILVGAGAETVFGICGGKDFAKAVLGIGTENRNDAVREYYKNKKMHDWYPRYNHKEWEICDLLEAALRKKYSNESTVLSTKKEFETLIAQDKEEALRNEQLIESIIEDHASYMGLLDGRFYTLIAPRALGPNKFWSVIECYTRAYLIIIENILRDNEQDKKQLLETLNDPKKTMLKIREICMNQYRKRESYYSIIREATSHKEISIVSSNYTPICNVVTGLQNDRIAYLHGRLGLFESPYTLQVYDVDEENEFPNDELLFPYIFIQSGIKPIIERKQIEEYTKMLRFFDESDEIIIVGYRMNSDDNHINSILHSYLTSGKKITYLDYDKGTSKEVILKRLRIDTNINNFVWRPINMIDCYNVFSGVLNS